MRQGVPEVVFGQWQGKHDAMLASKLGVSIAQILAIGSSKSTHETISLTLPTVCDILRFLVTWPSKRVPNLMQFQELENYASAAVFRAECLAEAFGRSSIPSKSRMRVESSGAYGRKYGKEKSPLLRTAILPQPKN